MDDRRNYKMNFLLYSCLLAFFGIQMCLSHGYTSNSIRDYHVKESAHFKSDDNEIRGRFNGHLNSLIRSDTSELNLEIETARTSQERDARTTHRKITDNFVLMTLYDNERSLFGPTTATAALLSR